MNTQIAQQHVDTLGGLLALATGDMTKGSPMCDTVVELCSALGDEAVVIEALQSRVMQRRIGALQQSLVGVLAPGEYRVSCKTDSSYNDDGGMSLFVEDIWLHMEDGTKMDFPRNNEAVFDEDYTEPYWHKELQLAVNNAGEDWLGELDDLPELSVNFEWAFQELEELMEGEGYSGSLWLTIDDLPESSATA